MLTTIITYLPKAPDLCITKSSVMTTNKENSTGAEQHPSWFSTLIERIQDLDTDFPLSGGAEHHHIVKHTHQQETATITAAPAETVAHAEHHSSWFSRVIGRIQDLEVDFPLSGGEHHN